MTSTLITERLTLTPVALSDYDDLRARGPTPCSSGTSSPNR